MFQQTCRQFGLKPHSPSPQSPIPYQPGEKSFRTWMDGSPSSQLDPIWKGPLSDLLSSPTAIKVPGIFNWFTIPGWSLGNCPLKAQALTHPHPWDTWRPHFLCKMTKDKNQCSVAAVQSLSCVWPCDPMDCSMLGSSVSTIPWSLLKFTSLESVMPTNHLSNNALSAGPTPHVMVLLSWLSFLFWTCVLPWTTLLHAYGTQTWLSSFPRPTLGISLNSMSPKLTQTLILQLLWSIIQPTLAQHLLDPEDYLMTPAPAHTSPPDGCVSLALASRQCYLCQ